jgi:serine/threonine protein kinase
MYAPPERLDLYDLGRSRDVWAFGCVVLELLVLLYVEWSTSVPIGVLPRRSRRGLNAVGAFREKREDCKDNYHSASFANNMSCVNQYIDNLWSLSWTDMVSDTKSHIMNSMLITVRAMVVKDPQRRGTASSISRSIQFPVQFARRGYPSSSPPRDRLSNDRRPSPPPDTPHDSPNNSLRREFMTINPAPKYNTTFEILSMCDRGLWKLWKYLQERRPFPRILTQIQDGLGSSGETMIKTLKKSELFQALCLTLSLLYYDYDANSILAKFLIGIFAYHLIFPRQNVLKARMD